MRISDNVFNKLESLEDLVYKMGHDKDGRMMADVGEASDFIPRYKHFKEYLKEKLPELTFEEILRMDELYHRYKDAVYAWHGHDRMLTCLEYEERCRIKL